MAVTSLWKVDRGRVTEIDQTAAGGATVTMIDTDHSVDPASGNSIMPGTPVAIGLGGFPVFTGYNRRHDYDLYQDGRYGVATISTRCCRGTSGSTEICR